MPTKKKHKKKIVMRPVIANQLTKNKDKFSTRSGISVPQNTSPKYPVFLEALPFFLLKKEVNESNVYNFFMVSKLIYLFTIS